MRKKMKNTLCSFGAAILALCLCNTVLAATYSCGSCDDCSSKVNSATAGDIVFLTTSLSGVAGECIRFNGQMNVAFDCQGYSISGSETDYGIHINSGSGNTVRNCAISHFSHGIHVYGSTGNTITKNSINNNNITGVYFLMSDNNNITNNTVNGNLLGGGIFLGYSNGCRVLDNTVGSNYEGYGIQLYYSDTATISGNTMSGNLYGIYFNRASDNTADSNRVCSQSTSDFKLTSSYGNTGDYNTCSVPAGWNDTGRTGCRYSCSGTTTTSTTTTSTTHTSTSTTSTAPTSTSTSTTSSTTSSSTSTSTSTTSTTTPSNTCNSCSDCTAKIKAASSGSTVTLAVNIMNQNGNCVFFDNKPGITLDCGGNRIQGNGINQSARGIYVNRSANSTVKNCNVSQFGSGILLYYSNNSAVLNSGSHDNSGDGAQVYYSSNCSLSGNTVVSNAGNGIVVWVSKIGRMINNTASFNTLTGIYLWSSNATTVTGNNARNNSNSGILLISSYYNNVADNTAGGNLNDGVKITSSNTNIFMHNTVCANTPKDFNQSSSSGNAGYNNTCDATSSWNDSGYSGCQYACAATTTTTSTTSTTGQTTTSSSSTTRPSTTTTSTSTTRSSTTTIPPLADLSITSIWPVGNEIRYSLWNYGSGAPASTSYMYVDGVFHSSGYASALGAGFTSSVEFFYNWTCNGLSDVIRICADGPNYITEANESNNCITDTIDCSTATTTTTTTTSSTTSTTRQSPRITVTRVLPLSAARGSILKVNLTMDINESSAPPAVGLTEYLPSGWGVSNISNGGLNKTGPDRIEWVFWPQGYPAKDQQISYRLNIPSDAYGTFTFSGTVDIGEVNLTDIVGSSALLLDVCALAGDTPPCGEIAVGEVVAYINLWSQGKAPLSSVVALINAWKKK